ncbi:hypothetical protein H8D57_01130, partial [bacterium]|nr:hypothetical protein [bacterium]
MSESKREIKFHGSIIKALPKFPNNKATKTKLEQMSLTTLLIHYLSWMCRYIAIKPREVEIEKSVQDDPRWITLQPQIDALLEKVRKGKDLTPHLSLQAHRKGYTPVASEKGPDVDRWADKDFLLNAMGYHHFHLGQKKEPKGHVIRTDDVVFARVTREKFTVVGIFDHSVFEPVGNKMSVERERLWSIFDEHVTRGASPGSVVISSPIATSGHPIHLVSTAQECFWIINQVNPRLDEKRFIDDLYSDAGIKVP